MARSSNGMPTAISRLERQGGAGDLLGSQFEPNMRRANFLEPVINNLKGQFGSIALAAQMAEIQVAKAGGHDFLRRFSGRLIQIGRASCRERVEISVGAVGV